MKEFEFEEVKNYKILKYYEHSEQSNLKGEQLLVEISKENVIEIERILQIDSSYAYGNACTLIKQLHEKKENNYGFTTIEKICLAINKENSTRISKVEIEKISKAICDQYKTYAELMKALNCRNIKVNKDKKNEINLIELIYNKNFRTDGKKNYISFATKFCHYMCLFNKDNRDKYPIFDNVLGRVIPLYVDYFKKSDDRFKNVESDFEDIIVVKGNEKYIDLRKREGQAKFNIIDNYNSYCQLLKMLKEKSKKEISFTGLDHLLWYCYKGRIKKGKEEESNEERND